MHQIDIGAVDLNLLVTLEHLLDTASVSETAARIGRTQSAVSHALSRLRDMFDDPLLVRTGQRLSLTSRARELRAPLAEALGQVSSLIASRGRFEPSRLLRSFRLGAADYHELVVLPAVMPRLGRDAPGVTLHTVGHGARVEDAVLTGELDLAIGVTKSERPGLVVERLFEDDLVVVMRKGHRLRDKRLTLTRYVAAHHALVSPRGRPGSLVDDALGALGRTRRVVLTLSSFVAAPLVIEQSDLLLTMPRRVVDALGGARRFFLAEPPLELAPIAVSLLYSVALENDPAHRWLRAVIADACPAL